MRGRKENLTEPKIKISGNKLIGYGHWHGHRETDPLTLQERGFNRKENPYSTFSTGSRKRLKEQLNRWIDTVTYANELLKIKSVLPIKKHTFITLTLSSRQIHCDKVIKREILNEYLINSKRKYNVKNFIWKSELQKNGNIHFHILSEGHVPHKQLRLDWNTFQNRLGYVDRFEKVWNHRDPNSTDIHELKKIRNVSAYVGKYMSKESTERPICGHTWGRSDGINKLLPYSFYESIELNEWYNMQTNSVPNNFFTAERFCVTTFLQKINLRTLPNEVKKQLTNITNENLHHLNLLK